MEAICRTLDKLETGQASSFRNLKQSKHNQPGNGVPFRRSSSASRARASSSRPTRAKASDFLGAHATRRTVRRLLVLAGPTVPDHIDGIAQGHHLSGWLSWTDLDSKD